MVRKNLTTFFSIKSDRIDSQKKILKFDQTSKITRLNFDFGVRFLLVWYRMAKFQGLLSKYAELYQITEDSYQLIRSSLFLHIAFSSRRVTKAMYGNKCLRKRSKLLRKQRCEGDCNVLIMSHALFCHNKMTIFFPFSTK